MGGQTSVPAGGQGVAIAGQLGDASDPSVKSGINEASTQIPFGYGLRDGTTNERGYLLATGFSGVLPIAGVALHGQNHVAAGNADADGNFQGDLGGSGLLQNAPIDVLRRGQVWLPVENTVTKGMRGWCRGIATGSLTPGVWAGAAVGAAGVGPFGASYHVDASKQVKFVTGVYTAADGTTQIALAECDFVNGPY